MKGVLLNIIVWMNVVSFGQGVGLEGVWRLKNPIEGNVECLFEDEVYSICYGVEFEGFIDTVVVKGAYLVKEDSLFFYNDDSELMFGYQILKLNNEELMLKYKERIDLYSRIPPRTDKRSR